MTDVIMPQMGESIAEGTVTKWMKNVGDRVERDEPLFEISTDKVDAEIPAPAAGILKEIRVQPGVTVPINTVVGVIAAEGQVATAAPPTVAAPAAAAAPPAAPPLPAAPAPPVSSAPPSPTAAPKAPPPPAPSRPVPAPAPQAPPAPARAAVPPVNFTLEPDASAPPAAEKPRSEMTVDELRQTRSSPVVRRIAAEHNLDIREIPGTGIAGRVTKQDILGHIGSRWEAPAPAERPVGQVLQAVPAAPPAPVAAPPPRAAAPPAPAAPSFTP